MDTGILFGRFKRNVAEKFNYGQQPYDFDSGVLTFVSPFQFLKLEINPDVVVEPTGWLLLIHPDFLWNTPLPILISLASWFFESLYHLQNHLLKNLVYVHYYSYVIIMIFCIIKIRAPN
jgi:hypothetical protein